MAAKIGPKERKRIEELLDLGLTHEVIAQRMGVTTRTIRVFARAKRENSVPYRPESKSLCTTPE